MTMTAQDIKKLKKLAHKKAAIVTLGAKGITDGLVSELNTALLDHELVKVKITLDDRDERTQTALKLAKRAKAALIGTVGKVAIFYKRHPEEPKIKLSINLD